MTPRGRTLLIPAIVSAIAVVSVAWWASRQQLPALPAASVALPRLAAALVLYALATALRGERWLRLLRDAGAYLADRRVRGHGRRLHGQQRAAGACR